MEKQIAFLLEYLPIKMTLLSLETALLPNYLGSTLRGVVGQALYSNMEAYQYLYENRRLGEKQQNIVNPYLIVPPMENKTTYRAGEELCFDIILLGDAAKHAKALVNALNRKLALGASRHPFVLIKAVHKLDKRILWQEHSYHPLAARRVVTPTCHLLNVKQLTIQTRTPLRIRRKGVLLETIDFPILIRNITRRLEALTTRYGGWIDQEESLCIQKLANEVTVVNNEMEMTSMQRYSNRQQKKMDFSGLTGMMQFEGNLTPFVPWLYAAQLLHIGRNTTFGMGAIEIEFV